MNVESKERRESAQFLNFKACPRCRGDIHVRRDMYGDYQECLQCGYMRDLQKRYQRTDRQAKAGKGRNAA